MTSPTPVNLDKSVYVLQYVTRFETVRHESILSGIDELAMRIASHVTMYPNAGLNLDFFSEDRTFQVKAFRDYMVFTEGNEIVPLMRYYSNSFYCDIEFRASIYPEMDEDEYMEWLEDHSTGEDETGDEQ